MTLCCQNRESKGTGQRYALHSSASISGHSASVTMLGLLKKKEEKKKELVQYGKLGVIVICNSNSKDYRKQCNSNSNIIEIFGEKE